MSELLSTLASNLVKLGDDLPLRGVALAESGWMASLPIFDRTLSFGISAEDLDEEEIIEKEFCKIVLSNGNYHSALIEKLREQAEQRFSKSNYYIDRHVTGYGRALARIQNEKEKYLSLKSIVDEKIQQVREKEIREKRLGYASNRTDRRSLHALVDKLVTKQLEGSGFARVKNKVIDQNSLTYEKQVDERFFMFFALLRQPLGSKNNVRKGYIGRLEAGCGISTESLKTAASIVPMLSYFMESVFPLTRLPYINPYIQFRHAEELEVITLANIDMLKIIAPDFERIILTVL